MKAMEAMRGNGKWGLPLSAYTPGSWLLRARGSIMAHLYFFVCEQFGWCTFLFEITVIEWHRIFRAKFIDSFQKLYSQAILINCHIFLLKYQELYE